MVELIIKSSADFWGDEWVKDGRKEVAEKDEEAKIKRLKKIVVVIPRAGILPLFRPAVVPAI